MNPPLPTPCVSVVVATFRRDQPLVDTVRDLLAQGYPALEVLVVDQAPNHQPAVAAQLSAWAAAGQIRYLLSDPPNLPRARNRGWRAATGEIVIFVDDDVRIPDPHYVASMVAAFLAHPEVGAVAGRILEPSRPPEVVRHRVGDLGWSGARRPGFGSPVSGPAYSLRGCNMAFRRSVLEAVGGFDEGYQRSAFREDADIAIRVQAAGFGLWFSAEAWLYHLSASTGGTRSSEIDVDNDVVANDLRFAVLRLSWPQRGCWILRLYLSRVVKAGVLRGRLWARHRAFFAAWWGLRPRGPRDRAGGRT
ncbi:MAG: glycosyltransferase [Firmicutes bacterium]|nr:glycosyltransferase family 2 protein [Alicyclobacillaceae bacterium]MCL6497131.1 glycosyltransferase [Bacillota bacterium]